MTSPTAGAISAPIVGAHFRPPAKQLLACLPAGTTLVCVPEPTNPYDPKAIKVFIAGEDIPPGQWPALEAALDGTGYLADDLVAVGVRTQIGYIADSDGKIIRERGGNGNREMAEAAAAAGFVEGELLGTLAFDSDGQAMFRLELYATGEV